MENQERLKVRSIGERQERRARFHIIIYLNNAVDMKAHHKLRDVTHQIVEPVVDSCQNVDRFVVVSEKQSN